jgi:transposase
MAAEIISTVERRRNWPTEVKLRILSEALLPGASVTAVANRNGVCRSQLYTWLRLARQDRLPGLALRPASVPAPAFAPVHIAPSPTSAQSPAAPSQSPTPSAPSCATAACTPPRRRAGVIEVVLPNGRTVKADEGIDASVLARIVAALDDAGT